MSDGDDGHTSSCTTNEHEGGPDHITLECASWSVIWSLAMVGRQSSDLSSWLINHKWVWLVECDARSIWNAKLCQLSWQGARHIAVSISQALKQDLTFMANSLAWQKLAHLCCQSFSNADWLIHRHGNIYAGAAKISVAHITIVIPSIRDITFHVIWEITSAKRHREVDRSCARIGVANVAIVIASVAPIWITIISQLPSSCSHKGGARCIAKQQHPASMPPNCMANGFKLSQVLTHCQPSIIPGLCLFAAQHPLLLQATFASSAYESAGQTC